MTSSAAPTGDYESSNGLAWRVTENSLFVADDSNTIDVAIQPDMDSCIEACSTTADCVYVVWVAAPSYSAAYECYLLNGHNPDFGTGYPGVDTAELLTGRV